MMRNETTQTGEEKMKKAAIVETSVFGVKAWHFRCLECGKEGKRRDSEREAVALAKKHGAKCTGPKRERINSKDAQEALRMVGPLTAWMR